MGSFDRRVAAAAVWLLRHVAPAHLRRWADDIAGEVAAIDDDRESRRFAFATMFGLLPTFLIAHVTGETPSRDAELESSCAQAGVRPGARAAAVWTAVASVGIGLFHLAMAGAPFRMIAINAVSLAIGVVILVIARRLRGQSGRARSSLMIGAAGLLLATAVLGTAVEGAARWVRIGGLFVQPSLILLPLLLLLFARSRGAAGALALILAAFALAVQPDRAMAGVMVAGLAALWSLRRERLVLIALMASAAAFLVTLFRSDDLPAVPFVDGVLVSSWQLHPLLGLLVLFGALLLAVPAMIGWKRDDANRPTYAVFGAVWLATVAAAALGAYPTPLVGYGGSAILGYLLGVTVLAPRTSRRPEADGESAIGDDLSALRFALPRAL